MSEGRNQPNRIESWILQDEDKPVSIAEDPKLPNAATITMRCQDHTMGNMIRSQLLLDPSVLFAGYKVPHPLENNIELRIQCDERSNPPDALKRACTLLIQQAVSVKKQFSDQARNIEMGMGPDAGAGGVGVGGGYGQAPGVGAGTGQAGAGVGGYDPYGDGLGGRGGGVGGGGQDVYDF